MIHRLALGGMFTAALLSCAVGANAQEESRPWRSADGGFRNLAGGPQRDVSTAAYLGYSLRRLGSTFGRPEPPPGHVLPPERAVAELAGLGARNSLTWIGHATFLIRLGGVAVLTDPFFGPRASPFRFMGPRRYVAPGLPIEALPPIDVIVLSHNHYDSLDSWTLARLPGKDRIEVVVPLGVGAIFERLGYARIHELEWTESVTVAGVTVTALPAHHWSRRGLGDENRTLWMGAALDGAGTRIYFSGDTAYAPYFPEWGERYGPFDYGIVGIGAYEPRELMRASHTTPEEAVRLGLDMGARTLVAMHWGTVRLGLEPPFEAPGRFRAQAAVRGLAPERVWVLAIGESRALD